MVTWLELLATPLTALLMMVINGTTLHNVFGWDGEKNAVSIPLHK
jgi:hypothetical protein